MLGKMGYPAFTGVVQADVRDRLIDVPVGKISVEEYVESLAGKR